MHESEKKKKKEKEKRKNKRKKRGRRIKQTLNTNPPVRKIFFIDIKPLLCTFENDNTVSH